MPDNNPQDYDSLCLQASASAKIGDWPSALSAWRMALSIRGDDVTACLGCCEALVQLGQFSAAEDVLVAGMSAAPDNAGLADSYARVSMRQGNWTEAIARWANIRAKFPGYLGGWLVGGECLREAGMLMEAEALFEEGEVRFPLEHWIPSYRAHIAELREDWLTALERWEQTRIRFPAHLTAWMAEVRVLRRLGRGSDAETLEARIQLEFPDHPDTLQLRLLSALEREDVLAAHTAWRTWISLQTQDVNTNHTLSQRFFNLCIRIGGHHEICEEVIEVLLLQQCSGAVPWCPTLVHVCRELELSWVQAGAAAVAAKQAIIDIVKRENRQPTLAGDFCRVLFDPALGFQEFVSIVDRVLSHPVTGGVGIQLFCDHGVPVDFKVGYLARYLLEGLPVVSSSDDRPRADRSGSDDYQTMFRMLLVSLCYSTPLFDEILHKIRYLLALMEPVERKNSSVMHDVPESLLKEMVSSFVSQRPTAGTAPGIIARRTGPLKIAICASGQLRGYESAYPTWKYLGFEGHDVDLFIHTWRDVGRRQPENIAHFQRCFQGRVLADMVMLGGTYGYDTLRARLPNLFRVFESVRCVTDQEVSEFYQTEHIGIDDEASDQFRIFTNCMKMHYKIKMCHQIMLKTNKNYDLVLRMRPDKEVVQSPQIDWEELHFRSITERRLFNDWAMNINDGGGLFMGDQIAVGSMDPMSVYADTFDFVQRCIQNGWSCIPGGFIPHSSLAYAVACAGVRTSIIPGMNFGRLLGARPLHSREVRQAITEDSGTQPVHDINHVLLAACAEDERNGL